MLSSCVGLDRREGVLFKDFSGLIKYGELGRGSTRVRNDRGLAGGARLSRAVEIGQIGSGLPSSSARSGGRSAPSRSMNVVASRCVLGDLCARRPFGSGRGNGPDADSGQVLVGLEQIVAGPLHDFEEVIRTSKTAAALGSGRFVLATSYSRTTFRRTTIGAAAFHFRVRNGNGWCHCARITRPEKRIALLGSGGPECFQG